MDIMEIPAAAKTPFIKIDLNLGVFEIKGKSIPENAKLFYSSLFDKLEEYAKKPAPQTVLNIQMDYFNTSSAKAIVDVFKKLERLNQSGASKTTINWYHDADDEDMIEAGKGYQSIIKTDFNLVPFSK